MRLDCVRPNKKKKNEFVSRAHYFGARINNALPPSGPKSDNRSRICAFLCTLSPYMAEVSYAARAVGGRRRPRLRQKDPPGINKHVKLLPSPAAPLRNNKLQSTLESIGGTHFPHTIQHFQSQR